MKFSLTAFPTLFVPVACYGIAALIWGGGEGGFAEALNQSALSMAMPAGVEWALSWGEIFVLFGLVALFVDLLKAAGTGAGTVVNHMLSALVFVLCLIVFLVAPPFVTSPFFLLMSMVLLDVIAGFTITIIAARRDVSFD